MVWLIVAGIAVFIVWAIWHERQLRHQDQQQEAEKRAVAAQRLQLEEMQMEDRQYERSEIMQAQLECLRQGDWSEASDSLEDLLKHSPPAEQWVLLQSVNQYFHQRYADRLQQTPLEPELIRLLKLLSARPEGFRKGDAGRKDCLTLTGICLQGFALEHFNLRGVELHQCQFEHARLPGLDLFAALAQDSSFEKSHLQRANLTGVMFKRVSFAGSDLSGAELITAELVDCNLTRVKLTKAALRGVRLSHCDLRGADLTGVSGLSFAQLKGCYLDDQTRLPDNLKDRLPELILSRSV